MLAGTVALLSGCGGDDGGGSSGLSKAELNRQAGAICKELDKRLAAIETPDLEDPEAVAASLGAVVAVGDEQIRKLRALEPEESLKADYDAYLASAQETREFYARIQKKAEDKDPSGLAELQRELRDERLEKGNQAAARKAGLTICGENEAEERHVISVRYDEPRTRVEQLAKEYLQVGGTDGVAEGFSKNFAFPADVTIHVHGGGERGSPNYDPSTKTVNLYYAFIDDTAGIIRRGQPDITDNQFGEQLASVNGFILVHELGHMFVDVFGIPITGREEDAVDGMATVFFTDAVPNGVQYAFHAARFFKELQELQGVPDVRQFQDEHGLSIQRAFDIVCSIAGKTEESMRRIAKLGILGRERLQRCPAEYRQKSRAWQTLLRPHLRSSQ